MLSIVYFQLNPFSGSIAFEIVDERVTFTEALNRCQLAQPHFQFENNTFKLTHEESLHLQNGSEYWLGYISTQAAYLYLGK